MSRLILNRSETTEAEKLHKSISDNDSRLIISEYGEYLGIFYIAENRLRVVKALAKESREGEIIIARIDNIKDNLGAAFVKLDPETVAFLKFTNIPDEYKPIKNGMLIPVKIISDEQKGKRIAVSAKIPKSKLSEDWKYKAAFSCIDKPQNQLAIYLEKNFKAFSINKLITDSEKAWSLITGNNNCFLNSINCEYYNDNQLTLSMLYSLKTKLNEANDSKVYLKSGGYLIINRTEALTVIDVNSGKNTPSKKEDVEAVKYELNVEAAIEAALQIKLRNLSGMILIDFINMESKENEEKLLHEMECAVTDDYVTVKVIDITPLGIMEMTRMKKDKPLNEFIKIFF